MVIFILHVKVFPYFPIFIDSDQYIFQLNFMRIQFFIDWCMNQNRKKKSSYCVNFMKKSLTFYIKKKSVAFDDFCFCVHIWGIYVLVKHFSKRFSGSCEDILFSSYTICITAVIEIERHLPIIFGHLHNSIECSRSFVVM